MNTSNLVIAAVVTAGFAFAVTDIAHAHTNISDFAQQSARNVDETADQLKLNSIELVHRAMEPTPPEIGKMVQLRKTRRRVRIATPRRTTHRHKPAGNRPRPGSFQNQGGAPQAVGLLLPAVQSAREVARPSPPPSTPPSQDDCMSCD